MDYEPDDLTPYDDERDARIWTPRRIIYLIIAILIIASLLLAMASGLLTPRRYLPPPPTPVIAPGDRVVVPPTRG